MKNNILATAVALSDQELLARIESLARSERETAAELVAHLAALELRPSLYVAEGYGSLFGYCRQALRLSEDAACTRIKAARACRRFPAILDLLASGTVSLTAVRMLGPHLTAENHAAVLARASHVALDDIKALVAELAPRPDVPASVRKLPIAAGPEVDSAPVGPSMQTAMCLPGLMVDAARGQVTLPATSIDSVATPQPPSERPAGDPQDGRSALASHGLPKVAATLPVCPPSHRPMVQPLAPGRYRLQCTIGQQTHDTLRRIQALLRREIPDGDPAAIIDQALELLLEKVEKAKLGSTAKPRHGVIRPEPSADSGGTVASPVRGAYETRIRFETDPRVARETEESPRPSGRQIGSRHIPNTVKGAVWRRDSGQCAFVVADTGRRCTEQTFLEFHHIRPYAWDGKATVENISLRCRRHNQYEAELIFGPRDASTVREADEVYAAGPATLD